MSTDVVNAASENDQSVVTDKEKLSVRAKKVTDVVKGVAVAYVGLQLGIAALRFFGKLSARAGTKWSISAWPAVFATGCFDSSTMAIYAAIYDNDDVEQPWPLTHTVQVVVFAARKAQMQAPRSHSASQPLSMRRRIRNRCVRQRLRKQRACVQVLSLSPGQEP
jgi:hypothetical protein